MSTPLTTSVTIELDQIQGNSIGGFSKDSQAMLFLRITDPAKAADTLRGSAAGDAAVGDGSVLADVDASTSEQVLRFNNQFKQLRSQGIKPESVISATWTNLVLTLQGMKKLGRSKSDLNHFPDAFRAGMKARAAKLGDTGASDPSNWEKIVDWDNVDVLLIIASDDPEEVDPKNADGRVGSYLATITAAGSGLELCAPTDAPPATDGEGPGQIYGATREDEAGHEHFGFKDGVSQPGVRGVDLPDDPIANPDQGHPGQDLLHPGEFIIGYPRQQPKHKQGHDGPNPDPSSVLSGHGPITHPPDPAVDPVGSRTKLPGWTKNGSFLVFRRLEQDVSGFRDFVSAQATALGIAEPLFGAKLVGRYKSGAPLEKRIFQGGDGFVPPSTDPGDPKIGGQPALGNDDSLNNEFEYGDDEEGDIVPLASHIRKAYPRDEVPVDGNDHPTTEEGATLDPRDAESRTQTHRLLRRGIPYGKSLPEGETTQPGDRRGLLFLAYQSDIARQFEFVEAAWVKNEDFPAPGAGQDPIMTPADTAGRNAPISMCPFHQSNGNGGKAKCPVDIQHFVTTRGGGYFFSPSIDALHDMLDAQRVGA